MISFAANSTHHQPLYAEDADGTRIDLTSYQELTFAIWNHPREGTDMVVKFEAPGVNLDIEDDDDPTEGEYHVHFFPGDVDAGLYKYEVWAILADGDDVPLGFGVLNVTENYRADET